MELTLRLRGVALGGCAAALLALSACGSPATDEPAGEPATTPAITEDPVVGTITGSLSFPSDYLPEDMQVCARDVDSAEQFCDAEKTGATYRMDLAEGRYTVWSQTGDQPGRQAFYTQFITCGQSVDCTDHSPVIVQVIAGQTADGVDPGDWYAD